MKREEGKGGEGEVEKKENLVEKLKRGILVVGKRGGQTTPVQPYWRLQHQLPAHFSHNGAQDSIFKNREEEISLNFPAVSARKLAATLWELDSYKLPLSKMHQGVSGGPTSKLQRHHNHHHHHHHQLIVKDKGLDHPDPSPSSPDLGSAGSLRRQVAASLMQHHRSIQRNHHAKQPVSPASYGSSMEVAPYNPVATPTSSADFRGGGNGETSYSLKTSAELLKVLNRIWNLEEQHASNVTLVRAMKKELDQARARIRELVRDKQADRHEINELMNQISDDKLARKSKEQDRAIQSVRDELEDERKLRKRSETLHRKLARELYEVKMSLAKAYKDLERERKSRKMLEELCDEFAWEIKNYEQEIHVLKQKSEKDLSSNRGDRDTLILHLSESWIDERMQMKQEPEFGLAENQCAVEKLSWEIQNFLAAKKNKSYESLGGVGPRGTARRRNSLESIPLNVGASAPQDQGDNDGSSEGSESHCFELEGPITVDLKPQGDGEGKSQLDVKKLISQDKTKARNLSSLQVKFEEQMAQAISVNEAKNQTVDVDVDEVKAKEESEITKKPRGEGGFEGRRKAKEAGKLNSDYINKLKSHYLLSESGTTPLENDYGDSHGNPVWRSHPSPVRQWTTKLPTQDLDISESSSKMPPEIKESTLKTKLLEARTRGQSQRSGPRLKPSKVHF